MQLRELFKICTKKLDNAGIEASTLEAGVILCYILNVDRAYLYAHPEKELKDEDVERILDLICKRCERLPLQQLLGVQEFMSLSFMVDGSVLIPRQDTEVLVETVLQYGEKIHGEIGILDLGTGSGCIAISLASYLNNSRVIAVDISDAALNVARKNAALNRVERKVSFIKSDLFMALPNEESFHIIVSNPPYIPTEDIKGLEPEVRDCEPMLALDGGADGLDFYRRIAKDGKSHFKEEGLLALEVGIYQAEMVGQILKENGYSDIKLIKDLSGIDRVVCGTFIPSRSL